ncbi:electron transporter SenC [Stutzerimonas stutzeri]|uniref:Electron transporter SenC n=1 Tax=Stutzerimonas stutzeri TaxID=316 RepID=W8QXF7_STUST|nr:SCO family protein [Stutzerimonas stutzeri]AHL75310.1 electron transporter SenC [Stutzerimonas stutzeri]MCQ4328140.1 SCO family protein [Stutzerimonas stutzeri]
MQSSAVPPTETFRYSASFRRVQRITALLLAWSVLLSVAPAMADAPFDPFTAAGVEQKPGAQVPLELRFTDVDGDHVTLGELFEGRPVILAPVYYRCPNVCGAQLSSLFNLLSALSFELGKDYEVIAFSIDPRETPQDAEAERAKLRKRWPQLVDSPHVHFLSEVAPATRPEPNPSHPAAGTALAEAVGFTYSWDPEIGEFAHASAIATLSPDGKLVRWLYGLGYQPDDMRLALTDAGEGKTGSLGDQLLLLCYHYNPRTGGYDNLVIGALQVGGIGTTLILGGFIGVTLWRERRKRKGSA